MTFDEMLDQVREVLQSKGRVAYRALKRRFDLEDGYEEGLTVAAEALAQVNKTGERFYEAKLYRLRGELSPRMGEREMRKTREEENIAHSPTRPFLSRGVFSQGD